MITNYNFSLYECNSFVIPYFYNNIIKTLGTIMTREVFIKKLETYQTSEAPYEVKAKAIERLKAEFQGLDQTFKHRQILADIMNSSSELKASELY